MAPCKGPNPGKLNVRLLRDSWNPDGCSWASYTLQRTKAHYGVLGSHGHSLSSSMRLVGLILLESTSPVDSTASRFGCKLQESEASSACLCVLAAWRTYAWTSASSGAPRALHTLPCTKCILVRRSALHVVRCIPKKVHPTCWWAAAKGRPPAFDLTRPLFQTVLSSLARVESVSGEM